MRAECPLCDAVATLPIEPESVPEAGLVIRCGGCGEKFRILPGGFCLATGGGGEGGSARPPGASPGAGPGGSVSPGSPDGARAGERRELVVEGVDVAFRWIPPGECVIGSPESEPGRHDKERQWTAEFSRGFWMGETPVTQALWQAVMGSNPSHFKESGPEAPVERVSWEDVQRFLKTVNDTMSTGAFRLPTEAEWEYAARAGSRGPFALPCDYRESNKEGKVPGLDRFAWYSENSGGHTHPVGELEPNAWGLHDVHGNVEEWCQDWFGDYPTGRRTDYAGSRTGGFRVLRGGSWYSVGRIPRSARRGWCGCGPGIRISVGGFRLVWSPSAPQG